MTFPAMDFDQAHSLKAWNTTSCGLNLRFNQNVAGYPHIGDNVVAW